MTKRASTRPPRRAGDACGAGSDCGRSHAALVPQRASPHTVRPPAHAPRQHPANHTNTDTTDTPQLAHASSSPSPNPPNALPTAAISSGNSSRCSCVKARAAGRTRAEPIAAPTRSAASSDSRQ
eukprot:4292050-Prymnesium_polylepis.2